MDETNRKPWSELALLLGAGAALLIAAAVSGALDSPEAWTLLALLAAGYALSRGFARSTWTAPAHHDRLDRLDRVASNGATAGHRNTEAEVVVSEEQLAVDKRRRPRERVQLRKEVVTEEVTITVPIRREVVRLERVPIREGELATDISDLGSGRTQELILMEETAIVDKRIIPRERVWLEKDVETREEQVTETVRHEEVEVDHLAPTDNQEENR
jgi:uncharacterized protein (TIGR02271 family)